MCKSTSEDGFETSTSSITGFLDETDLGVDTISDILRIEDDISVSWNGVRGCCADGRAQSEVNGRFSTWRGNKISENSSRRYRNSGYPGATAQCRSSGGGGWPNPPASCSGFVTIKAWIEFV